MKKEDDINFKLAIAKHMLGVYGSEFKLMKEFLKQMELHHLHRESVDIHNYKQRLIEFAQQQPEYKMLKEKREIQEQIQREREVHLK